MSHKELGGVRGCTNFGRAFDAPPNKPSNWSDSALRVRCIIGDTRFRVGTTGRQHIMGSDETAVLRPAWGSHSAPLTKTT